MACGSKGVARALGVLVGVALVGCGKGQAPPPTPPPSPVTVARPVKMEVIEWDDYNGHLEATNFIELRAQVSGLLESVTFEEGGIVKEGDTLFQLDARPFKAQRDHAAADVERAEAQLDYDKSELKRVEGLRGTGASSEKEYLSQVLAEKRSEADLAAEKAALDLAQQNLDYTTIKAPISGRISKKLVTPGNLVTGGATQSTLLTTIASIDPIYCYVEADERSVLKYQRLAREKKRVSARDSQIPCWMGLSDQTDFPYAGVIDFVDNQLVTNTGTLQARGIFKNPGGVLTPGLFARMRVPGSGRYLACLVSDEAIQTDQNQKFVYVVDDQNMAQYRKIEEGPIYAGLRVIKSGVTETDKVIVNGLMKVRPGAPVAPQDGQMHALNPVRAGTVGPGTQAIPTTQELEGTSRNEVLPPAEDDTRGPASQPSMSPSTTQPSETR